MNNFIISTIFVFWYVSINLMAQDDTLGVQCFEPTKSTATSLAKYGGYPVDSPAQISLNDPLHYKRVVLNDGTINLFYERDNTQILHGINGYPNYPTT